MPSLAKRIFSAGVKESVSHAPKPAPLKLEFEGSVQSLPNPGSGPSWRKHIKKTKGVAYRIPDGVEYDVDAPKGYIKLRRGDNTYFVREDFAKQFAKQEGKRLSIAGGG